LLIFHFATHGLRRGLHSAAASRLDFGRFDLIAALKAPRHPKAGFSANQQATLVKPGGQTWRL
jgi:hypothetical protein